MNTSARHSTNRRVTQISWLSGPWRLVHRQRRPIGASEGKQPDGEQPEGEAADVCEVGDAFAARSDPAHPVQAGEAEVELLEEPEAEQEDRGDLDDRDEEDDEDEAQDAGPGIQQQVAAEHPGDRAGGAERGDGGEIGLELPLWY